MAEPVRRDEGVCIGSERTVGPKGGCLIVQLAAAKIQPLSQALHISDVHVVIAIVFFVYRIFAK